MQEDSWTKVMWNSNNKAKMKGRNTEEKWILQPIDALKYLLYEAL